jgi:hypothetical protein
MIYGCGDAFCGSWKFGKPAGIGKYLLVDGGKFVGTWK